MSNYRHSAIEAITPARAGLEVATGHTSRSLRELTTGDPKLGRERESIWHKRIALFALSPIYIPISQTPPPVGALVSFLLPDKTRAIGEVLFIRESHPMVGAGIRYIPLVNQASPTESSAEPQVFENAWEELVTASQVPELPQTVSAILRVTSNPRSGAADIAREMAKDAALSDAVLALANASGLRGGEKLDNVRAAVVRLGLERVRTLVLASSILKIFPEDKAQANALVSSKGIWTHSLTAAFAAETVAEAAGHPPEDAFLAGLLHDVGKLLIPRLLGTEYQTILNSLLNKSSTLTDLERVAFGFTHAKAGAWLLARWKLPGSIVNAVAGTHPSDNSLRTDRLAAAAHVGDLYARALAAGSTLDDIMPKADKGYFELLGIDAQNLGESFTHAATRIAAGAGAFAQFNLSPVLEPDQPNLTDAEGILRAAARACAKKRTSELFTTEHLPNGLDSRTTALKTAASNFA